MLITNVTLRGKPIALAENSNHNSSNVVTVLMGSNGCGKSRVFQAICTAFIRSSQSSRITFDDRDIENLIIDDSFDSVSYSIDDDSHLICVEKRTFIENYDLGDGKYLRLFANFPYRGNSSISVDTNTNDKSVINSLSDSFLSKVEWQSKQLLLIKNGNAVPELNLPSKILAITGSPYDKFPFSGTYARNGFPANYVYLGSREKRQAGARFNRSYLSSKFDQLGASFIKLLLKPKREQFDFSTVLDFLNLSYKFTLKLVLNERIREEELTKDRILELVRGVKFFKNKEHNEICEENQKDELSSKLLRALEYVTRGRLKEHRSHFDPLKLPCVVELNNEQCDNDYLNSLAILSDYDLIELEDVEFSKCTNQQKFLLSQASSGELSLLFTMSSIAAEIKDDTLILIDEPELSLHPEWQLKLLPLITSTFSKYRKCHFIIATHSPNIVSSIPRKNAYVVDLGSNNAVLMPSEVYHNRSVDFQLARAFNAPGNSNEYLIKTAINIFSKVKENKYFDEDDLDNLKLLNNLSNYIPDKDPVLELIEMLNEVHGKYGRN